MKNQSLGFEMLWRDGATPRRYLPDFIVRIDDGHGPDDSLNLVVEIEGQKDVTTQIKAETARTLWVPGVNNLKTFDRWSFAKFSEVFAIEEAFGNLVRNILSERRELEIA